MGRVIVLDLHGSRCEQRVALRTRRLHSSIRMGLGVVGGGGGGGVWLGMGVRSCLLTLACLRGGGRPAASVCGRGVRAVLVQHVTPCADIYTRLYRLAAPCRVVSLLHVDELPLCCHYPYAVCWSHFRTTLYSVLQMYSVFCILYTCVHYIYRYIVV